MNLDARAEWIVENEDNFDEHATFVETEMVGSGIIVERLLENDDLDERLGARVAKRSSPSLISLG